MGMDRQDRDCARARVEVMGRELRSLQASLIVAYGFPDGRVFACAQGDAWCRELVGLLAHDRPVPSPLTTLRAVGDDEAAPFTDGPVDVDGGRHRG